jgi:hypothetical protein
LAALEKSAACPTATSSKMNAAASGKTGDDADLPETFEDAASRRSPCIVSRGHNGKPLRN